MKKESQTTRPKMLVVLGQTATGKSSLAVILAQKYNGEIISADSRQVYRGLNLGTGKITKKEMRGVRHYLVDVANPTQQFSVTDYQNLTKRAIQQILKNKKLPILCGGTGFYIDAIVDDKRFPEVPPNKKLRTKLATKTPSELFALLKKLDPKRAQTIDSKNPVRLIRAIEIASALGRVPSLRTHRNKFSILKIGLTLPDKTLQKKIRARLVERLHKGMLLETRRVHLRGLTFRRMDELGLEYRFLANLLQKKLPRDEFVEKLTQAIWHYAKRQKTWFKRDPKIQWFDSSRKNLVLKIEPRVRKFLQNSTSE